MNVVFIYPKMVWKFLKTPYPPLGIGYLATILLNNDYNVSLIDGQIEPDKTYEKMILNIKAEIVCISVSIKQIEEANRIIDIIKKNKPNTIIIIGGPGISILNVNKITNIDIIMKGEADFELLYLLNEIKNKKNINKITKYQKINNTIIVNCKTPSNLDDIPFPSRRILSLNRYLDIWKKNTGMTSTSLISSRGCPFKCIFCDKNISGYSYRPRSFKNVVDEMEYLSINYKIDDLFFYDDLFVFDNKRVELICNEILKRNLKVNWSAQARVDMVNYKMIKLMKKSGCSELYFGAESGSNKILRYLNKGFNYNQIVEAFKSCHKAGVRPGMFIIVGIPGETIEDINETKKLIKVCKPYLLNFSYLMPFPGTELYKKTKKWIRNYNYSEWDEMTNSIYNYPFEISPKKAHDEIYKTFKEMIRLNSKYSSLQFICEQ